MNNTTVDDYEPIHLICKSAKEAVHSKYSPKSVTILDELIDENSTLLTFISDLQRVIVNCYDHYGNNYTLVIRDNQRIVDIMHTLQRRVYTGDDYGKDCVRMITMKHCELMGGIINNAGNKIIIDKVKTYDK